MMRNDFPPELVGPLRFLASKRIPPEALATRRTVESLRKALAGRSDLLDFPRGPRAMAEVANTISVGEDFGTFLYLCASAVKAERVLELGVGGGIGSCYLALTPSCREYVGVDIAPQAIAVGGSNLRTCVNPSKVRLMETSFDEALLRLSNECSRFDFIWLDGDHYTEPALRYAQRSLALLKPGGIFALDDLRWSGGVFEAWQIIRRWPGFRHTIDAGRLGLGVWSGEGETASHWDFSRALYWPWGAAADASELPPVGKNPTM